jgi:hypothetical protein
MGGTKRYWIALAAVLAVAAVVVPAALAVTINGALTNTDPTQTGRLTRNGIQASCASPKSNPGLFTTGAFHYDAYRFFNTSGSTQCVTIAITNADANCNAFSAAYSSFNPANPSANWLADPGLSTGVPPTPTSFSLNIPANSAFDVVVSEVNAGGGCASYTLVVTGTGIATLAGCGTVTQNTTLQADCAAPLTIGASGITVDLNGHSIVCDFATDGIVVPSGRNANTVKNGFVGNGAGTCTNGIHVGGDSNQFTSINVSSPSADGVHGDNTADSNRFTSVNVNGAGGTGFNIFGDGNVVRLSNVTNSGDDGIAFFTGFNNSASRNVVQNNGDKGIISGSSFTTISANRVNFNDYGILLSDNSFGNKVFLNSVLGNSISGIQIGGQAPSTGNAVQSNASFVNGIDMVEGNPNCSTDSWFVNAFGTRNQNCIH